MATPSPTVFELASSRPFLSLVSPNRRLPEQQGVGVEGLVELELVALLPPIELEAPASVPEVLGPARVLHHAVERDELGHHDPRHASSSSSGCIQPIS